MTEEQANQLAREALAAACLIIDLAVDRIMSERGAITLGNCSQSQLSELQLVLLMDIKPTPIVVMKETYLS
jgi:hypothetical protein